MKECVFCNIVKTGDNNIDEMINIFNDNKKLLKNI